MPLLQTLERANAACNWISEQAWAKRVFSQFAIHALVYHEARERFGLSSQMAIRCIAKVADAYKAGKKKQRRFKPHGAIAYDDRILRYGDGFVSIWTLDGRLKIPFVCGEPQQALLVSQKGESELVYRSGEWYLLACCDVEEPRTAVVFDHLGVDLGIVNIAADSDGKAHSGAKIEAVRQRHHRNRQRLQKKGTRGAKKKLHRMSGREARFRRHVNHCISKDLVARAEGTGRGLALEDLKGIRSRTTVRKPQRARHAGWSFAQLRSFIEYKAKRLGVPVVLVNAAYTSQTCSACDHCEKANRKSQARFLCQKCGFSMNADLNSARNIRARAACKPAPELSRLTA